MFCKNCGKEIDDKAAVCPHCGVAQNEQQPIDDSGSIGWGVSDAVFLLLALSFFLFGMTQSQRMQRPLELEL